MTTAPPVIVTRPEPGNAATVARFAARGLVADGIPLFVARGLAWDTPDPRDFDVLLLTSAQAVRFAGPGLKALGGLPVHAVGSATAAAAEAAGLRVARVGATDGQALIDAMTPEERQRILWLCGRERSVFNVRGAALTALPCYGVDPIDPPASWAGLTGEPALILAHSSRGAARIAALTEGRRGHLSLVAISAKAAAAAGGGWAGIAVTPTPDDAAMVTTAHHLWQKAQK